MLQNHKEFQKRTVWSKHRLKPLGHRVTTVFQRVRINGVAYSTENAVITAKRQVHQINSTEHSPS